MIMAIVRCPQHDRSSPNQKHIYSAYSTCPGAVCGIPGCQANGRVWLAEDKGEVQAHERGQRVFPVPNSAAVKLRVTDMLVRAEYGR